jgi:hypothetical protein
MVSVGPGGEVGSLTVTIKDASAVVLLVLSVGGIVGVPSCPGLGDRESS